ncbi:hypothetical protein GGI21_006573, partial [Coemansia aciculifera]
MAHLESMRYRKQPGAAAGSGDHDEATVISGMSSAAGGTPVTFDGDDGYSGDRTAVPNSDLGYSYEKKDLDFANSTAPLSPFAGGERQHHRFSISRNQWITLGFIVLAAAYVRLWRL